MHTRRKNILIVMLQIFDNLLHYKNIVTVQWIKRLKLCMVTMATLPPAKELKIQVVSWQNEIRTLDVLQSPTWCCGLEQDALLYHCLVLVRHSKTRPDVTEKIVDWVVKNQIKRSSKCSDEPVQIKLHVCSVSRKKYDKPTSGKASLCR